MQKSKQSIQTVRFKEWIGLHFRAKSRKIKCAQFGLIGKTLVHLLLLFIYTIFIYSEALDAEEAQKANSLKKQNQSSVYFNIYVCG